MLTTFFFLHPLLHGFLAAVPFERQPSPGLSLQVLVMMLFLSYAWRYLVKFFCLFAWLRFSFAYGLVCVLCSPFPPPASRVNRSTEDHASSPHLYGSRPLHCTLVNTSIILQMQTVVMAFKFATSLAQENTKVAWNFCESCRDLKRSVLLSNGQNLFFFSVKKKKKKKAGIL